MEEKKERVMKYATFIVECSNRDGGEAEVEIVLIFDYEEDKYHVTITAIDIENQKINCLMREEWFNNDELWKADEYFMYECSYVMRKWRK